ncbi:MAG TPA: TetR/AcrR family transcriptional regulator [Chloroflexota bacterium]|nr:TetR/AcrR family transcriptional regulator [Chloroflexota bacterium]
MPKISPAHEQQRREQILAAAMTCFARQGYHATSMDDVVRESGLSVGAIYSYFPSKEELFLTLSETRAEQSLAYLNELFARPGSIADKSREAVDYFFDRLSDDLVPLARVNVEFLSEALKSERIKERQDRRCESIRQFFHSLLSEAQRRGEVRGDVNIQAAAELMMALNEGIVLLSVTGLRRVPLEALKVAYIAMLDAGLARPDHSLFPSIGPANGAVASAGLRNGTHPKGGS